MIINKEDLFGIATISEINEMLDVNPDVLQQDVQGRDFKVISYEEEKEFRKYATFYMSVVAYIEMQGGVQYCIVMDGIWDESYGTEWDSIQIEKGILTEETEIIPAKEIITKVWTPSN